MLWFKAYSILIGRARDGGREEREERKKKSQRGEREEKECQRKAAR